MRGWPMALMRTKRAGEFGAFGRPRASPINCRAVSFSLGATPSSMSSMMASALSPRALSIIFCLWPGTNIQDRFKSIVCFPLAGFIT